VNRVVPMAKKPFTQSDFFDFSKIERQVADIKKEKTNNSNDTKDNDQLTEILQNQLSILQEIQYLLTEIEKNNRSQKRFSLFNKNN